MYLNRCNGAGDSPMAERVPLTSIVVAATTTIPIHNHASSLYSEIDLLFKATRVSQCVFTIST